MLNPPSWLQWRDGLTYCSFKDLCTLPSNTTHCSCHDEVDLSICFEDSAVLYGIFILFWFLAGLEFLLGRSNGKPKIHFNLLHAAKLVRLCCMCMCTECFGAKGTKFRYEISDLFFLFCLPELI